MKYKVEPDGHLRITDDNQKSKKEGGGGWGGCIIFIIVVVVISSIIIGITMYFNKDKPEVSISEVEHENNNSFGYGDYYIEHISDNE